MDGDEGQPELLDGAEEPEERPLVGDFTADAGVPVRGLLKIEPVEMTGPVIRQPPADAYLELV